MSRPSSLWGASVLLSTLAGCGDPQPPPVEVPPGAVPQLTTSEPCARAGLTTKSRFPAGNMVGHPDPFAASARGKARAARIRDQSWIRQPADARQKVRLGDVLLINDKIAVYVEDTGLSDGYQALGGEILGIEPVGADGRPSGTSLYGETLLFFSRQAVGPESVTILNDGENGKAAVVRVSGTLSNIPFLTEGFGALLNQEYDLPAALDYSLEPGEERMRVTLSLMNPGGEPVDMSQIRGAGFFHASRSQRYTPDAGYADPTGRVQWVGFDNPGASFAFRSVGGGPLDFVISQSGFEMYRMLPPASQAAAVQLPACQTATLDYAEWIVSGPGIDNLRAAVRRVDGDKSWREVRGKVLESGGGPLAGAYVHVRSAAGKHLTRALTDGKGEFALHAPAEPVDLLVTQGGFTISQPHRLAPAESAAMLTLPASGTLVVHVRDEDSKQPLPVRIQVLPDDPVPGFPSDFGVEQEWDGRAVIEFTPNGEARLALRPGQHRVIISRGFEWELKDEKVAISAGKETVLNADLFHSVDSAGVMCADFHIHSLYSADSSDPVNFKVRSAVADGLEIPVSSEHEWIIDFQPIIKELGLASWAFGMPSEEFTTFTWGHFGIVPLYARPEQVNNGAIAWIGKKPPEVFHSINGLPEHPVLIINHPRSGSFGSGYFTVADFQRSTTEGDPELWSSEFEALEVFNDSDFESNRSESVADWFALLNAGKKVWAVGNSDSHAVRGSPVGYPRTCLRFGHDDPQRLTPETVRDALRSGQATVSGGLYITVEGPNGVGPGADVPSAKDPVQFKVAVQAPMWLSATRLEVIVNGETVDTLELQESTGTPGRCSRLQPGLCSRRYEKLVTLRHGARPQSWVVFHAKAAGRDLSPIFPGRKPFAVSNPIFF